MNIFASTKTQGSRLDGRFIRKVAVITGGAGGIGLAIANKLAERGTNIALVDIDQQALEFAQTIILQTNPHCHVSLHPTDVTDTLAMQELRDNVMNEHGRVDFLFNNAGMTITRSFKEHSLEHWQTIFNLNLWAVITASKFFLSDIEKSQGMIINTSSLAGLLGFPYQAGYSLTKCAVRSLSETMYAECKADGVHVMSVHPGAIRTDLINKAVKDSDNPGLTQKLADLTNRTALEPEQLAEKMIHGIIRKKQRIVVGMDAQAMDFLKRLMPSTIHKLFAALFTKAYSKTQ